MSQAKSSRVKAVATLDTNSHRFHADLFVTDLV